jgi:LPS export ABC transporter permease LptF/LPS export ABC transporter permease LptG
VKKKSQARAFRWPRIRKFLLPSILDRYIIREILSPTLIGLLVFTFILLMDTILRIAEFWIERGVPLISILRILFYNLPWILALTLPMAILLGILIAFGRMSADSEVIAMTSGGISVYRLYVPVFLYTLVGFLLTCFLMVTILPAANQALRNEMFKTLSANTVSGNVKPRIFNENFPGFVIYIKDQRGGENIWKDLFISHTPPNSDPIIVLADEGYIAYDETHRKVWLELLNGTVQSISSADPETSKYTLTELHELLVYDNSKDMKFEGLAKGEREKTIPELLDTIEEHKEQGKPYASLQVEIHKKFSIPFACIVFGIIGLPLGITARRANKSIGFLISIVIIFIYRFFLIHGETFADAGELSPFLGMWMANFILGVIGIYFLIKKARNRPFYVSKLYPYVQKAFVAVYKALSSRRIELNGWRIKIRVMYIIDRYLISNFLRFFLLVLVCLVAIYIFAEFSEILDDIQDHNLPLSISLEYFFFHLPQIMWWIIPPATLMTTLITFGLLTKNSEVTAMKASGISLYRIAVPILTTAAVICVGVFLMQDRILPTSNKRAMEIRDVIKKGPSKTYHSINNQWLLGEGSRFYNFLTYDEPNGTLQRIHLYDVSENNKLERIIVAKDAKWQETITGKDGLPKNRWQFSEGWEKKFKGKDIEKFRYFDSADFLLPENHGFFARENRTPQLMTYMELKKYISVLKKSGLDTTEASVMSGIKLSWPVITLILTLIGIPFSFKMGKQGALYGICISFIGCIIYWGVMCTFRALGNTGILSPFLAAWAPNILFGLAGIYLLLTVRS